MELLEIVEEPQNSNWKYYEQFSLRDRVLSESEKKKHLEKELDFAPF